MPTLTDAAIASMFDRRARRGDASDLRDPILRTVRSTSQVRRWHLEMPALLRLRMARLLVLALVVLALAALALVGASALREEPRPKETANAFVRPFEFSIPAGSGLLAAPGGRHGDVVSWVEGSGVPLDPSAEPLYGGQRPFSGYVRGIIVASGEQDWSHSPGGRFFLHPAPADFLADLRDTARMKMGPIALTSLDGRPAVATRLVGTSSNDIHVRMPITGLGSEQTFILLDDPAQLIVTEVDGETILLLIWARTPADLDVWMPVADRFVASIHFLPEAEPS